MTIVLGTLVVIAVWLAVGFLYSLGAILITAAVDHCRNHPPTRKATP